MIHYYEDLEQGTPEWLQARCGILTASEVELILTPTLKSASNDKERAHLYELLAQRITQHVEPGFLTDDMLRGHEDEVEAKILYAEKCAPVTETGFITNDKWGFTIGYSPDGLVGDDGLLECKSRRQKYQVETILEAVPADTAPLDYMLQLQTGLMVSERKWIDFISYSGGLPMVVIRVWPDTRIQNAIIEAAGAFEARLQEKMAKYQATLATAARLFPTERRVEMEIAL